MAKSVIEEKKASYGNYLQNKQCNTLLNAKKSNNKKDKKTTKKYWEHFVVISEGSNGNAKLGVKIFKQLQIQERDKLKINQNKNRMKRYYGKLWSDLCNNGEEEIEKEMTVENIGLTKWKSVGTCKTGNEPV